ncbi:hypothetical protein ABT354_20600 [Streptomyces sp. NPDC000594]|uniref:hypothetical protein n=1 Tax=Streptomyces sp. NPDC000594 TaxID=3154261 RepID=UPI00331A3626
MQTVTTPFRLNSFRDPRRTQGFERWRDPDPRHTNGSQGWHGTSPELGEIVITFGFTDSGERIWSIAEGEAIPTVRYESKGLHVMAGLRMPTLNGGTLWVGEDEVAMSRNRLGVTDQGRALHLIHGDDTYRLRAIGPLHYVLARDPSGARPGTTIQVKQSGKNGMRAMKSGRLSIAFTIEGAAGPTDIALATIFSGVDRSALTPTGAVRAMFARSCDQVVAWGS